MDGRQKREEGDGQVEEVLRVAAGHLAEDRHDGAADGGVVVGLVRVVFELVLELRVGRAEGVGVLKEDLIEAEDGLLADVRLLVTQKVDNIRDQILRQIGGADGREAVERESDLVNVRRVEITLHQRRAEGEDVGVLVEGERGRNVADALVLEVGVGHDLNDVEGGVVRGIAEHCEVGELHNSGDLNHLDGAGNFRLERLDALLNRLGLGLLAVAELADNLSKGVLEQNLRRGLGGILRHFFFVVPSV